MDNAEIRARLRKIVIAETRNCMGRDGGVLSNARAELKRRYLGYGYGIDADRTARGLSTYVDRTVLETVEWAKPGLFRVFASGDEIIRFDPRSPEQEQAAADATLYVNQVVFGKNIFSLIHDVLSDGLYQRVGWCIAHCPQKEEQRVRQFTGLSPQEAEAILMDPSVDLETEGAVRVETYESPAGQLVDMTVHQKVMTRNVLIEPVPSEQVIISGDAASVEDARFIAHWDVKTYSELRREGYAEALLEELPQYDSADDMPEAEVTRAVNDDGGSDDGSGTPARENRRYRIFEAWTDADINGDGVAEKVKVTYCGEAEQCRIMAFEEWPLYRAPLFSACSVPMPHSAVGLCLADLVSDLQDLRTEVTRQYLDNLALANQGELVASDGQNGKIDYDSLLARGIGSVHRISGDASITPLPVASSSGEALQGLEMSSVAVERRTGVSSRTQSLQADTLQNSATGASIMEEAINQRLELIARVYAEQFFKPLGRYVLHLLHRYQDKTIHLRLKGRFMAFDPRKWDPDMDISVAVGLGTGNRSKMVAAYQQILQIQQTFIAQLGKNSPVRLSNVIKTCHKMAEAAGIEAPEQFFGTEEDAKKAEAAIMAAPEQPSPEQQKLALEQRKAQAKMQGDAYKLQTEAQRKAYETQSKLALEREQMQGKMALKAMEMQGEKELDQARLLMGERGSGLTNLRGVM